MTWYSGGTIAVTNNSTAVTGTGTVWVANTRAGQAVRMPNGNIHEIQSVNSNTSLTLTRAYTGSTASAQAYEVVPVQGYIRDLATSVDALVSGFVSVRDGIGTGQFPDGTLVLPGFRFAGDVDTGIYRPATDAMGMVAGGVERMRVTPAGVSFGTPTTPEALLQVNGGHSGCFARMYSSGSGTGDDASIDWFCSQPNVAYSGGGFGYNINKTRAGGKRNVAQGACSLEFAADGQFQIWQASSAQSTLTNRLAFTAAGLLSFNAESGNGLVVQNGSDNSRGVSLRVSGGSGTGNADLLTTSSGYNLRVGTDSVARWVFGTDGRFFPFADNGYPIGGPANRPNVIYAGTSTINTSDARDKTWRGSATAQELTAAKRIIAELGFYQWNGAIAEKGADGARYHFGARAQAVWAIMAEEGLVEPLAPSGKPGVCLYAFLCYDEWDAVPAVEEETDGNGNVVVEASAGREAGSRFGIRTDQLALFLIAAQEKRLAALEAAAI